MNSRDVILRRIRTCLVSSPPAQRPPAPEVWPVERPDAAAMGTRFASELQAVHGEAVPCRSMDEARQKVAELMDQGQWGRLGAVDTPLARQVTGSLAADRVAWVDDGWKPTQIAELPSGLIAAEWLLADTGTCVVECNTASQRLMCYLPPVCVVIARADQLREHLPAAWPEIAKKTAEPDRRGEYVLVTGPSRTADIEKILILGVHGPKRLVVLLVGHGDT